MEMVIEDYPCVGLQSFVLAAMRQGTNEQVATGRGCEHRKPFDDRGSNEVRAVRLPGLVTAAHREKLPQGGPFRQVRSRRGAERSWSFEDRCVPKPGAWEREEAAPRVPRMCGRRRRSIQSISGNPRRGFPTPGERTTSPSL